MAGAAAGGSAGAARPAPGVVARALAAAPERKFSLLLFVALGFLIPDVLSLNIGPMRLPPIRVLLLIAAVPVFLAYVGSARIRLRSHDYLFFAFVGWTVLCMAVNRGLDGYQRIGNFTLEYLVMYMAVSVFLVNVAQILRFLNIVFLVILVLGVLAAVESMSNRYILMDLALKFVGGGQYWIFEGGDGARRLGLWRATSVFSHPILYGVFCAVFLSFAWYVHRSVATRLVKCAIIAGATFFSLSAGPMLALTLQIGFIALETVTRGIKGRAPIILWSSFVFLAFVQVAAESGVYRLVQLVSLEGGSAWYRQLIWIHSLDDVLRSPLFGMLPENWEKPGWMTPSLDNQLILFAMDGGIPALVFLLAALVALTRRLFVRPDAALSFELAGLRRAWTFSVLAMTLVAGTVAFFDKMPPLYALVIGLGATICRLVEEARAPGAAPAATPPSLAPGAPRRPRVVIG